MTYERFLEITMGLKKQDELVSELYEKIIDLIEFVDPYHKIISKLIKEVYGEEGYDWWSWFCYDAEYGEKDWSKAPVFSGDKIIKEAGEVRWGATDESGNPICYSFESTWKYLEENYNQQNKK